MCIRDSGYTFRRITCPLKDKNCKECLLKTKCVYAYIFETPRPEDSKIMRKYESIPRPFIFEPALNNKQVYLQDEKFAFKLTLIGKAIDYLPYFIYALDEMGKNGLGKNRGKLELISVKQGSRTIYDGKDKKIKNEIKPKQLKLTNAKKPVSKIKIKFLTPFRIIYEGKVVQHLDFHILIRSLLRRIGLLSYFHSDTPYDIDFTNLISKAGEVRILHSDLTLQDQYRYSTRQHQRIPIQGMIGEITYQGNLTDFIPYLKIGEMLHIGKGTVFGMGKYNLEVMG
ncbi:MAG: CRISPR system precrRNA processing endoribonuclease RAMP protein Cas6, partial [candidate division WOR-3 bacterium]|nr:CRISPR system precrRNA processing endoribonuclease RAMP protein Cas6 [candidate division WOR-3 bacterium]